MVLEKGDGSVWGYVARFGRDSYQGMHGAAQKACEPGELRRKTPSPRRISSCFPLGMCSGLSFFILFVSFFTAFLPFFTYRNTEQGWGNREAAARQMCARGGGWMSSRDETRVTRKDGKKVENTSNQQQLNA
jgi:hypothetical protein